jgi:hypothetical protein
MGDGESATTYPAVAVGRLAGAEVQRVGEEAAGVLQARGLEPVPRVLGHVDVVLLPVRAAVGEVGGDAEVEAVGDAVDLLVALVPPQTSTVGTGEDALGAPSLAHVLEDGLCRVEVLLLVGDVVDLDPCQGPPRLVVVVVVEEALEAALLEAGAWRVLFQLVGKLGVVRGDPPGSHLGRHLLRVGVGVCKNGLDVLVVVAIDLQEIGNDGQAVGAVPPPGGLPESGVFVVPFLERYESFLARTVVWNRSLFGDGCRLATGRTCG